MIPIQSRYQQCEHCGADCCHIGESSAYEPCWGRVVGCGDGAHVCSAHQEYPKVAPAPVDTWAEYWAVNRRIPPIVCEGIITRDVKK